MSFCIPSTTAAGAGISSTSSGSCAAPRMANAIRQAAAMAGPTTDAIARFRIGKKGSTAPLRESSPRRWTAYLVSLTLSARRTAFVIGIFAAVGEVAAGRKTFQPVTSGEWGVQETDSYATAAVWVGEGVPLKCVGGFASLLGRRVPEVRQPQTGPLLPVPHRLSSWPSTLRGERQVSYLSLAQRGLCGMGSAAAQCRRVAGHARLPVVHGCFRNRHRPGYLSLGDQRSTPRRRTRRMWPSASQCSRIRRSVRMAEPGILRRI